MKKSRVYLLVLMLVFGVFSLNVKAQDYLIPEDNEDISISASVTFNSQFVSRGFLRDTDPVMQTGVSGVYKGFNVTVWGSNDMGSRDSRNSNRVFYMADYTAKLQDISITTGIGYYDYTGASDRGKEAYTSIKTNLFLSPALTVFYGWGDSAANNNGGTLYSVLSLGHSIPLGDSPATFDLSGYIAHNRKYYTIGDSGGDALLTLGLTLPLTENLTVKPHANYAIPFGDVADSDDGNQDSEFYGGITLAFNF